MSTNFDLPLADSTNAGLFGPSEKTKLAGIEAGAQVNVKPDWNAAAGSTAEILNKPTIPAAQVNADWSATSGVAQILNKPALATVATSGNYSDLNGLPYIPAAQVNADWNATSGVAQILNKPTIPAAQVNADWSATSGVAQILNKPALATVATSGNYSDLNGLPSIPAAQVNADWNATSGVAQILNKPTIPAAQVNADWNATSGVAQILNKPSLLTPGGGTGQLQYNTGSGLGGASGTSWDNTNQNLTLTGNFILIPETNSIADKQIICSTADGTSFAGIGLRPYGAGQLALTSLTDANTGGPADLVHCYWQDTTKVGSASGSAAVIRGQGTNRLSIESNGTLTHIANTGRFEWEGEDTGGTYLSFIAYTAGSANGRTFDFNNSGQTPTKATPLSVSTVSNSYDIAWFQSLNESTFARTVLSKIDGKGNFVGPNISLSGYADLAKISAPVSPASGYARLFAKDDGSGNTQLAFKDSAGNVTVLNTVPIASATMLGGIKVGSGLSVDGTGVLSVVTSNIATLGQNTFTRGQIITEGTANEEILKATGYSLTGSAANALLDLSGTWNTTGTPTAIKLNLTNTASNSGSLVMDLRVNNTSIFNIGANSNMYTLGWITSQGGAIQMYDGSQKGWSIGYRSGSQGVMEFYIQGKASPGTMISFGASSNSSVAIKRSGTTLQGRLADDSGFCAVQGKLTTDTAYSSGTITPTGYLVLYDANGTAYRVPCVAN